MKKIGKYLLKNKICDESSLKRALEQKSELKRKGVFKPVGSILTESMGVVVKDLNKALHQMHYDIISESNFVAL